MTITPNAGLPNGGDRWFLPDELSKNLEDKYPGLSRDEAAEVLSAGWEFMRCLVPEFTSWERYLAMTRLLTINLVAEFRASAGDIAFGDLVCGYDIEELLGVVFGDTPVREEMSREYRGMLLLTAAKSGMSRHARLLSRLTEALANSPADYFRIRDCDFGSRFTFAGAMACNEVSGGWLSERENQILAEVAVGMYDAIAFHKHQAEGEICNVFAYSDPSLRPSVYRMYREALWALDTTWSRSVAKRCVVNFARYGGGPVHMLMRRYRFVENGLVVGLPESEGTVAAASQNVKLWHHLAPGSSQAGETEVAGSYYRTVMAGERKWLFPGLANLLGQSNAARCPSCRPPEAHRAEETAGFGGMRLCNGCRSEWDAYLRDFPSRLKEVLETPCPSPRSVEMFAMRKFDVRDT
ncbi:hypothetical protein LKL35_35450 [Streptomyces sp. ET3-23]|uniref:hypothetical protein n=1 Tax=Streptomyces sp. ET3-23 TaxID=2885643 RepID=UPI001D119C41|nr:hypothetical protein [Streptomyces sp. ET3-23]MCC2280660.1 hypothetical protein [Streptomyces sp. ET3-23]